MGKVSLKIDLAKAKRMVYKSVARPASVMDQLHLPAANFLGVSIGGWLILRLAALTILNL